MALPSGTYELNVYVTFGVWVRRAGAWQKVTQVSGSFYGMYNNANNQTYYANFDGSVQLGTGIEAFGVTVDSVDGGNAPTSIDFTRVQWTAQGAAAGTRTALPNGSTTTVTVRPK